MRAFQLLLKSETESVRGFEKSFSCRKPSGSCATHDLKLGVSKAKWSSRAYATSWKSVGFNQRTSRPVRGHWRMWSLLSEELLPRDIVVKSLGSPRAKVSRIPQSAVWDAGATREAAALDGRHVGKSLMRLCPSFSIRGKSTELLDSGCSHLLYPHGGSGQTSNTFNSLGGGAMAPYELCRMRIRAALAISRLHYRQETRPRDVRSIIKPIVRLQKIVSRVQSDVRAVVDEEDGSDDELCALLQDLQSDIKAIVERQGEIASAELKRKAEDLVGKAYGKLLVEGMG